MWQLYSKTKDIRNQVKFPTKSFHGLCCGRWKTQPFSFEETVFEIFEGVIWKCHTCPKSVRKFQYTRRILREFFNCSSVWKVAPFSKLPWTESHSALSLFVRKNFECIFPLYECQTDDSFLVACQSSTIPPGVKASYVHDWAKLILNNLLCVPQEAISGWLIRRWSR